LLGERYSAADLLWGTALGWITGFKLLEATPAVSAYIERVQSRPAVEKARALDDELAAKQAAARGAAGVS
jgi:glutathione S-transferase